MRNYYNIGLCIGSVKNPTVKRRPINQGFDPSIGENLRNRAMAIVLARGIPGAAHEPTVVAFPVAGGQEVSHFATREEAYQHYSALADHQGDYLYAAVFDPNDETPERAWPTPSDEFGSAILSGIVRARPDRVITTETTSEGPWGWVAAGIAGILGLMVVSSKRKHPGGH